VLTVTDGTHTANINIVGTYTLANFHFASDGSGGTLITDPQTNGLNTFDATDKENSTGATLTVGNSVDITSNHFNSGDELESFTISSHRHENNLAIDPPLVNKHSLSLNPSAEAIELFSPHDTSTMDAASSWESNSSHKGHFDTLWISDFVSQDGVDAASIHRSGYDLGNFVLSNDGHGDTLVIDPPTVANDPVIQNQSTDTLKPFTPHGTGHVYVEGSSEDGNPQEQDPMHWSTDRLDHFVSSISQSTANSSTSFGMDLVGRDNFVFQSTSTGGTLAGPVADFGNHGNLSGYLHGFSQNEPIQSVLDQHWHDVISDLQQGQQSLQAIVSATTSENHAPTQAPNASMAIGEMIAQLNAPHDFLIHH
jgi:hypothetical protein